jgi:hypothetical protein
MPGAGTASLFVGPPAQGTVSVRAPAGLALFAARDGRLEPSNLPMAYADGRYTVTLDGREPVTWLVLRPRNR